MADDAAARLLKAGAAWLVVVVGLVILGVTVNVALMATLALGMVLMAGLTGFSREISIPFALSFIAVLLVVIEFILPKAIVTRLPDIGKLIGIPFGSLDTLQLFILTVLAILVIWAIEIRGAKRAVKPETVTKRMRTRAEKLVDTYITIGRLIAGFFLTAALMLLSEIGQLAGEAGGWLAEVPFIGSSVTLGISGFLSLGGELPVIGSLPLLGTLGATEFAGFAVIVVALAAAVRFDD